MQIIDRISSELFSDEDRALISFSLVEVHSQERLNHLLESWDIEVAGAEKALLLSYVMKSNPDLKFPDYFGPRLSGLLKYYRFQNVRLMSHFNKICSELSRHQIEIMPIKGGAMKALRPDLAREMGDIDIIVPEKDYKAAVRIAASLGYDCIKDKHSTDIHEKSSGLNVIDIHKWIPIISKKGANINEDLFRRASRKNVFGVDVLLPCNEDIFFIAIMNLSRNIIGNTSTKGIPFTLFDLQYLVESKPDFNWSIVAENAEKTSSQKEITFISRLVDSVVPGIVHKEIVSLADDKGSEDFSELVLFRRYYMCPLQKQSQQLKVDAVLHNLKLMPSFFKVRPKYTFLKLFNHSLHSAKVLNKIIFK